jgi:hypothetical protein
MTEPSLVGDRLAFGEGAFNHEGAVELGSLQVGSGEVYVGQISIGEIGFLKIRAVAQITASDQRGACDGRAE